MTAAEVRSARCEVPGEAHLTRLFAERFDLATATARIELSRCGWHVDRARDDLRVGRVTAASREMLEASESLARGMTALSQALAALQQKDLK